MMKLKHLFDNRDLAVMLLKNWKYDADRMDELNHFRISTNAVYPFYCDGAPRFLRFAPVSEKEMGGVFAELDFLRHLREHGFHAVDVMPSKDGELAVVRNTPWGEYVAVVFAGATGKRVDWLEPTESLCEGLGRTLAQLHVLSMEYAPSEGVRRPDWRELLDRSEDWLLACGAPKIAHTEANLLRERLAALPTDTAHYGLIHYDFERDNVFYDAASGVFTTIDFDDSLYCWYAMDVDQSLDDLLDELPDDRKAQAEAAFLGGYRAVRPVADALLYYRPVFRRFGNLIGYARTLRSLQETWQNEPDWMLGLREHIAELLLQRASAFGQTME